MCTRKSKFGLMRIALIFVSISFVLQILAFISPLWLLVEIEAVNITVSKYSDNGNYSDWYLYNNSNESILDSIINTSEAHRIKDDNNITTVSRGFGLWYLVVCVNKNCTLEDYPGWREVNLEVNDIYDHGYNFSWLDERVPMGRQREFLIEMLLALATLFIGLMQVWYQKRLYRTNNTRETVEKCRSYRNGGSILCLVIQGCLIWMPFLRFVEVNRQVKHFIMCEGDSLLNGTHFDTVTVEVPFSILFAGSGLVLSALACGIVILTASLRRSENRSTSLHINDIPLNSRQYDSRLQQSFTNSTDVMDSVLYHYDADVPSASSRYNERNLDMPPNGFAYANIGNTARMNSSDTTVEHDLPPSYEEAMRLCVKNDSKV